MNRTSTFAQFAESNGYDMPTLLLNPDMIGPLIDSFVAGVEEGELVYDPKKFPTVTRKSSSSTLEPGMVVKIAGKEYVCLRISPAGATVRPLERETRTVRTTKVNKKGEIEEAVVNFSKAGNELVISLNTPGEYRLDLGVQQQTRRKAMSSASAKTHENGRTKGGQMNAEPISRKKVPPPMKKAPTFPRAVPPEIEKTGDGRILVNGYEVSAVRMTPRRTEGADLKPCLCGCKILVPDYFKRGHIQRWNGKLKRVERGESEPANEFGKKIAEALGPWRKVKGGGLKPTHEYRDLRN